MSYSTSTPPLDLIDESGQNRTPAAIIEDAIKDAITKLPEGTGKDEAVNACDSLVHAAVDLAGRVRGTEDAPQNKVQISISGYESGSNAIARTASCTVSVNAVVVVEPTAETPEDVATEGTAVDG